jgi:hypothetical protein
MAAFIWACIALVGGRACHSKSFILPQAPKFETQSNSLLTATLTRQNGLTPVS